MPNYSSSQPCGLDFIISVLQIRKYRLSGAKSFSYTAHLSNRHLTIELWLQNLWLFYSTKELQTLSFIYLFNFTLLYWFCHTLTWISHRCTRVPHPEPSSHLPPHPIPLGHPSAPAPSILYPASNLDWWIVSYMILYMFQCHPPKSPTLSLSNRVHKTDLYISVSFAVSYTGLLLPSF